MFGFFVGTACLMGLFYVLRRERWHHAHGHWRGHGHWHGHGHGRWRGHHHGSGHVDGGGPDGAFGGHGGGFCTSRDREGHAFGHRAQRSFLRQAFERLGTSPGQERVILEAVEDVTREARSASEKAWRGRADVAKALRGTELDHEVMKLLFLRQDEALDELQKTALISLEKVHGALTPEQRRQLADLLEQGAFGRAH